MTNLRRGEGMTEVPWVLLRTITPIAAPKS